VRTQIVKIGNSQGIRIPKLILKQSSIKDEVEIKAQNGNIIIFPAKHPRHDWDEAFQTMHEQSDDKMLDDNLTNQTRWDEEEWER
jgi:antitoxin MazE